MVTEADFDVLGHLDIVRRDSWDLFKQTLNLNAFHGTIDQTLQKLIDAGRGLEVNTSGLRKGLPEPNPSLSVLRRYRKLGGEILVFGSDGHRPRQLGHGFKDARNLALAAGFRHTVRYKERRIVDWLTL